MGACIDKSLKRHLTDLLISVTTCLTLSIEASVNLKRTQNPSSISITVRTTAKTAFPSSMDHIMLIYLDLLGQRIKPGEDLLLLP